MQLLRIQHGFRLSFCIGGELRVDFEFGDGNCYFLTCFFIRKTHTGNYPVGSIFIQLDKIIFYKCPGSFHQQHISCDAAIVPPVECHSGNGVFGTAVVHFYRQEVVTVFQQVCHFHLERSKTAFVLCYLFSVQVDFATIADSTEIKKLAFVCQAFGIKVTGIPYSAFVILQFGRLRVPVSRNIKTQPAFKRVFIEIDISFRLPVLIDFHPLPLVVQVDDSIPFTIQRMDVATIYIRYQLLCRNASSKND